MPRITPATIATVTKIAVGALAISSFVLLALTSWTGAGYLLAALTIIVVLSPRTENPLGCIPEQTLLVAAFLIDYAEGTPGRMAEWVYSTTGVVIFLLLFSLRMIDRYLITQTVYAAHLDGVPADRKPLIRTKTLATAFAGLVAVAGATAAADFTPWPVAALTAVAVLASAVDVAQAILAQRKARPVREDIRRAVERYSPEFVFYHSGPPGSDFHITMWLPYLERLGRRFMIVMRETHSFANIAALTRVPVIVCRGTEDLDNVVVDSLTAAFYANNGMKNAQLVRFTQLTHVQLLHGDSEKAPSFNQVTGMYDRVYVAGQAAIDRYADNGVDISPSKFVIVGRPQVEAIVPVRTEIARIAAPTVMYATTWSGYFEDTNHSSLKPHGMAIVRALLARGATVIFRPHPLTTRDPGLARVVTAIEQALAADAVATGRAHVYGAASTAMSLVESFNAADALICDVSSVASDWLYSEKPLALADLAPGGQAVGDQSPLGRVSYVVNPDGGNLAEVLNDLLGPDPLAEARRAAKTHYLGDMPADRYTDAFLEAARADIERVRVTAPNGTGVIRPRTALPEPV